MGSARERETESRGEVEVVVVRDAGDADVGVAEVEEAGGSEIVTGSTVARKGAGAVEAGTSMGDDSVEVPASDRR